jgi:hypothetical protein
MNLNEFFNSLAENASRNFKIDQLNANSDNETLREVIRLALDPFTQFYQRKIPEYEFVGEDSEHPDFTRNGNAEFILLVKSRSHW